MARFSIGDDLAPRVASGVVMIALALAATYVGGFYFVAFWGVAALGVAWEWQRLIGGGRIGLRTLAAALALIAAAPWALFAHAFISLSLLVAGAVAVGAAADEDKRIRCGAGVLYAGAAMVAPALLRASPTQGFAAVLWLYAIVWGTDIGAYFGGRLLGGPKLWPAVSPGKTWSGALVGALAASVLALAAAAVFVPVRLHWAPLVAFGLVASALAQAGDLYESALKRQAGVKDTSRLIPGHGGLMDRLDGFIVAATFAAVVAWARSDGHWIAPGLFVW